MLRSTLIWVSTIGGILGLLFLFLDRYEALSVSPWIVGALVLLSIFAAVVLASHERRAKKREERGGLEENKTVLRDEIRSNLQHLASQIKYAETMKPEMPTIPRRPGETRAQFEDRARDEFARWVDYFSSMYQQFAFTDATYAAQRVNVATFEETSRLAVERAYAAIIEAKKRFLLYVEQLRGLLESTPDDSDRRHRRAQVLMRQTVNALTSRWFEILENWLLLNPTETDLRSVVGILPWVLEENLHPSRLEAGAIGRRFALRQQARLAEENVKLVDEEMAGSRPAPTAVPPTDAVEAVSKAGLAYLQGDPNHAVEYLKTALRFGTLTEDQEHYVTRVAPYKHWMEKASKKQTIFSSKPRGVTAWIFLGNRLVSRLKTVSI
jgi:hypothetical protein